MNIEYKIVNKKITDSIPLPQYATDGSAAIDLRACIESDRTIQPKEKILIPTGIAIHIRDSNVAGMVLPRSGLGHKQGLILGNSVGLIDSDYQGELFVSMQNTGESAYIIEVGERIAQMTFVNIVNVVLDEVKEFRSVSERGEGGFGSSGKHSIAKQKSAKTDTNAVDIDRDITIVNNLIKKVDDLEKKLDQITPKPKEKPKPVKKPVAKKTPKPKVAISKRRGPIKSKS